MKLRRIKLIPSAHVLHCYWKTTNTATSVLYQVTLHLQQGFAKAWTVATVKCPCKRNDFSKRFEPHINVLYSSILLKKWNINWIYLSSLSADVSISCSSSIFRFVKYFTLSVFIVESGSRHESFGYKSYFFQ